MKIRKLYSFCLIAIIVIAAVVMQGCPSHMPETPDTDVSAWFYAPADSVYMRYYTMKDSGEEKHEISFAPNNKAQFIKWWSGSSKIAGDKAYDSEYNDLHVRKKTNIAPAYVMRSGWVIINDQQIAWDYFPSKYYGLNGPTNLPFIEDVIDSVCAYYPEAVIVIDDLKEHSINNDATLSSPPSIRMN